jgi:peptidoglycan hydrolase-like protein with peptidoglycan-binding domain
VKSFQKAEGIKVSGVVGSDTWPLLIKPLRYGAKNGAVKTLQTELS